MSMVVLGVSAFFHALVDLCAKRALTPSDSVWVMFPEAIRGVTVPAFGVLFSE
jgi:hypothetical protein